jgi:hypothetical protein
LAEAKPDLGVAFLMGEPALVLLLHQPRPHFIGDFPHHLQGGRQRRFVGNFEGRRVVGQPESEGHGLIDQLVVLEQHRHRRTLDLGHCVLQPRGQSIIIIIIIIIIINTTSMNSRTQH